jgi:putative hydrolase of the HAD superfamily
VSERRPRALLVDFGGVLTTSILESFSRFSESVGAEPDLVTRLLRDDPESARLLVENECGRLDDAGFDRAFAERLRAHGVAEPGSDIVHRMQAGMRPDERMLAAVARLRDAQVPVALVTNSFGAHCYDGYDLDAIADVIVRSGELGVRKPSRRIYAVACERLGVEPVDSVLVDDVEHNLAGAARLGIRGILHVDADSTIPALEALFGVALDEPVTSPTSFDQGDTR